MPGQGTEGKSDGTIGSSGEKQQGNRFDTVMLSHQWGLSQQAIHDELQAIPALLDRLHASVDVMEQTKAAFMLRSQVQAYERKYPGHDTLSTLLAQLDQILFDGLSVEVCSELLLIAEKSPATAAYLEQVAKHQAMTGAGDEVVQAMIQWVKKPSHEDSYLHYNRKSQSQADGSVPPGVMKEWEFNTLAGNRSSVSYSIPLMTLSEEDYLRFKNRLSSAQESGSMPFTWLDDSARELHLGYRYAELVLLTEHDEQARELIRSLEAGLQLSILNVQQAQDERALSLEQERQSLRLSQLEHMWNHRSSAEEIITWNTRYSGAALYQLNEQLSQACNMNDQLDLLKSHSDWLLLSQNQGDELKFITRNLSSLRKAGFTTLVMEKKQDVLERSLWQALLDEAARLKIEIVWLGDNPVLLPAGNQPAWARIWQESASREICVEQLNALRKTGRKVVLLTDSRYLQSGDGFNGTQAGIARRLLSPILTLNGNRLKAIADASLVTLPHCVSLMLPQQLKEQAHVPWKFRGDSYYAILALLEKLHTTQGKEYIETAFVLKNQLMVYHEKYPFSPRSKAFSMLEQQLDELLSGSDAMKPLAPEDKQIIDQIAQTRPVLAAMLWQAVGSTQFFEPGCRPDFTAQLLRFVQDDSLLQMTGFTLPVETALPFEAIFHIPVAEKDWHAVKWLLSEAKQQGYLRRAEFSWGDGMLHLGYCWQDMKRFLSTYPKPLLFVASRIKEVFYEAMNGIRLPGETDESVILSHFANKNYLARLQREHLAQFEQGLKTTFMDEEAMSTWDRLYTQTEEQWSQQPQQQSLFDNVSFLLQRHSGLLLANNEGHAFNIIKKEMARLHAAGITTLGISWLSREHQPLIDDFFATHRSALPGDLKMLLTPEQCDFFNEARSLELDIVALHHQQADFLVAGTTEQRMLYQHAAVSQVAELLNSLAQKGKKFIAMTDASHFQSYRFSDTGFLPGLSRLMHYPAFAVSRSGQLSMLSDNPLSLPARIRETASVERDIPQPAVNVDRSNELSLPLPWGVPHEEEMSSETLLVRTKAILAGQTEGVPLIREAMAVLTSFTSNLYPPVNYEVLESAFLIANHVRNTRAVLETGLRSYNGPPSPESRARSVLLNRYAVLIDEIYHRFLGHLDIDKRGEIIGLSHSSPAQGASVYQQYMEQEVTLVMTARELSDEINTLLSEDREVELLARGAFEEIMFFIKRFPRQRYNTKVAQAVFIFINYLLKNQGALLDSRLIAEAYREFTAAQKQLLVNEDSVADKSVNDDSHLSLPWKSPLHAVIVGTVERWLYMLHQILFEDDFNPSYKKRITALAMKHPELAAFLYDSARRERLSADRQGFTDALINLIQSMNREHLSSLNVVAMKEISSALEFAWRIHESEHLIRWDARYSGAAGDALNQQLSAKTSREQLAMLFKQYPGLLITVSGGRMLHPLSHVVKSLPDLFARHEGIVDKVVFVLNMSSLLQPELDRYMAQDDRQALGAALAEWARGQDMEDYMLFADDWSEISTANLLAKLHDNRSRIRLRALYDNLYGGPLSKLASTASTAQMLLDMAENEKFVVITDREVLQSSAGLEGVNGLHEMMPGLSQRLDLPVFALSHERFRMDVDPEFLRTPERFSAASNHHPETWSLPLETSFSFSGTGQNHYQLIVQLEDSRSGDRDIFCKKLTEQLKKDITHSLLVFLPKGKAPDFLIIRPTGWQAISAEEARDIMMRWPPGETQMLLFGLGRETLNGQRELAGRDESRLAEEITKLNNKLITMGITLPESVCIKDTSWAGKERKAKFEQRFLSEKSQNWEGIPTLDQIDAFAAIPFKKKGGTSRKIAETLQEFWQHSNEGAGRVYRARIAVRLWKEMNDYITRYPNSRRMPEFRRRKEYIAKNMASLQTELRYQEEVATLQRELKFLMQGGQAEENLHNTVMEQHQDDFFRVLTTQDLIRYRITQPAADMLDRGSEGVYRHRDNGRRYLCVEENYYEVSGPLGNLYIIAAEEGAAGLQVPRPGINVSCNADGQWGFNPHTGGRGGEADRTYLYRFLKNTLGDFIRKDLRAFLDDRAAELTAGGAKPSKKSLLQALGRSLSTLLTDRLAGSLSEESNPNIAKALQILNNSEALHESILHVLARVFVPGQGGHLLTAPSDEGISAGLRESLDALLAPELSVFARETERPLLRVTEMLQESTDQLPSIRQDAAQDSNGVMMPVEAGQLPVTLKQRAVRALAILHNLQRQPLLSLDSLSGKVLTPFLAPEKRKISVFSLAQLAVDSVGIQALQHSLKRLVALDENMQADYLAGLNDYDALEEIRKADTGQNTFMRMTRETGGGRDTGVILVPQQIYLNITAPLSDCWQEVNALGTGWVLNTLYQSQYSTIPASGGEPGHYDWAELMSLHTDISLRASRKMAFTQEINAAGALRKRLLDLNQETLWTAPQERSLSFLSALSEDGYYRIESGRNLLFVEKNAQDWRLYDPRGALITFTESGQGTAEQGRLFTDRLMAYLCTQNEALQVQSAQHVAGIKHSLMGEPLFWVSRFDLSRWSVQGAAHRFLTEADYFMADNKHLHGSMVELGGESFSRGQLLALGIAEIDRLPPDVRSSLVIGAFSVDVHRLRATASIWTQIVDQNPGSLAAQAASKALDKLDRALQDPGLQEAKTVLFTSLNANTSSTLPQGSPVGSIRTLAQSLAPAFDATQQGMMLLSMLSAISTLCRYHQRDPASLSAEEKEQYALTWAHVGLTMTALADPAWAMAVRGMPLLFRNTAPWVTRLASVEEVPFLRAVLADLSLKENSSLVSMVENGMRTLGNGLKLLSSVSGLGFIALNGYHGYKDIQALLTETDPLKKIGLGIDFAACAANTGLMLVQMSLGRMGVAVPELLPLYAAIEVTSRVTEATLRYEEQVEQYEKTLHLTLAEKIGVFAASWKGEQDTDVRERVLQVQELKVAVEEAGRQVQAFCVRYQQALQKQAQTMDITYNGESDVILRYRFLARRGLSGEVVGLFEFDFPAMMVFLQKQGITPERESSIQSLIDDAVNHSGTYGDARREKLAARMRELQNNHPELRLRALNLQDFPELCKTGVNREIPTPDWSWWDKFWYEMKSKFGLTPHSQTPDQMERISLHWNHSDPEALSPSRWHFRARGDRTLDADMPDASQPDGVQVIRRSPEVPLAQQGLLQAVKRPQILMRMASLEAEGRTKTIVMKGRQDADNTLEITGQDVATVQLMGGEADDHFILNSALLKGNIKGGNGRNTLIYNAAGLPKGREVYQVTLGGAQQVGKAGSRGAAEWLTLTDIDHASVPVVETDITGNSNANTLQASHGILHGKGGRDRFIVLTGSGQHLILRDCSTEGDRTSDVILPTGNDMALISRRIVERRNSVDIVLTFRLKGNNSHPVEKSITLESVWKKSASDEVLLLNHEWNLSAGSLRLRLPAVVRKSALHQWELPVLQCEPVLPSPQQYRLLSTRQHWHGNTVSVSWQALDRKTGEVRTAADSLQAEPGAVILSLTGIPGSEDKLIGHAHANNTFLNLQGGDSATGSVTGTDTFQLAMPDEEAGVVTLLAGQESRLILPWSLQEKSHRLISDDTGSLTLSQGFWSIVLQRHSSYEGPQRVNVLDSTGNASVLWVSQNRKQAYLASTLLDVLPDGSFRVPQGHKAPVILHAATESLRLDARWCTENVSLVDKTAQGGLLAGSLVAQNSILTLNGDYHIEGGQQADIIMGGEGDDSLLGRQGDDWLNGGRGRNSYYWQRGDGNDHIQDEGEDSQLIISGVDEASLQWEISKDGHLILLDVASGARLTLYHGGTEQGGISTVRIRQQREDLGVDVLMGTQEIRYRVTKKNQQDNDIVTSENRQTTGLSLPVDIPGNEVYLWPRHDRLRPPVVKLPWLFTQTDIRYADTGLVFMHAEDPTQHAHFTLTFPVKEGQYAYLQDAAGDIWVLGQTIGAESRVTWLHPQQQKSRLTMNPDEHAAFMAALRSFPKILLTRGSDIDARKALLRVDPVAAGSFSTERHSFSLRDEDGNPVVLEVPQPVSEWRLRQEGQHTTVLNFPDDDAVTGIAEVRFTDLHADNAMPAYLWCRKEDRYWRLQPDDEGHPRLRQAGENPLVTASTLYFPLPQGSRFTGTEADDTYLIPAEGSQYRITDPAGQDTLILDVSDVRTITLKRIEKKRDLEIKAELITDTDEIAETRILITGQFGGSEDAGIERILVREQESGLQYELRREAITGLTDAMVVWQEEDPQSLSLHDIILMKNKVMHYWQPVAQSILMK